MTHDDKNTIYKYFADESLTNVQVNTALIGSIKQYYANSAAFITQKDAERLRMSLNR